MTEIRAQRDRSGARLASEVDHPTGRRRSDRVVGASAATQEAVELAMAAAASELPVRLSGPPGSGKEHIARAIHAWSARASGPIVVMPCAALNEPLAARELFGCAAGFTSALPEAYEGALSRAEGGTLLIDHIERVPSALRERLAIALAEGRYPREGSSTPLPVRARVMVSSLEPIEPSPFGELPHHSIVLRPLSERPDDVLPLAAHFLRLYAEEEGIEAVGFTSDARNALVVEPWPGNVRELAERVRQALRLAGNGAISAEALLLATDAEEVPSFKEAKRAF